MISSRHGPQDGFLVGGAGRALLCVQRREGADHASIAQRRHWVRPELVAEVKFLSWTQDNLLRQVVYEGLREDKPAKEVRREVPHPKIDTGGRAGAANKPPARR